MEVHMRSETSTVALEAHGPAGAQNQQHPSGGGGDEARSWSRRGRAAHARAHLAGSPGEVRGSDHKRIWRWRNHSRVLALLMCGHLHRERESEPFLARSAVIQFRPLALLLRRLECRAHFVCVSMVAGRLHCTAPAATNPLTSRCAYRPAAPASAATSAISRNCIMPGGTGGNRKRADRRKRWRCFAQI